MHLHPKITFIASSEKFNNRNESCYSNFLWGSWNSHLHAYLTHGCFIYVHHTKNYFLQQGLCGPSPITASFFFSFIFFVSFFDLSSLTKTLFLWTYLYSPPLQETLGLTQRSLLLVSCFPIVHFLKQHQTISTVFYAQDVSWWCTVLHLDMDIYTLHLIALLIWFALLILLV